MPPQIFSHDFETPLAVTLAAEGIAAALPYMRDPSLLPALLYNDSTDLFGPVSVTYTVTDPQGLTSSPATQLIYFAMSPVLCPGPEVACADDTCSVEGLCFPAGLSISPSAGIGQTTMLEPDGFTPRVDTSPPVITLLGAAPMHRLVFTAAAATIMEAHVTVGDVYVDPGAVAFDDVDGYLTARVSARGAAAVGTVNPTPPDRPHRIVYSVADVAGNEAIRAERRVFVGCPSGRALCETEAGWFCSLQDAECVGAPRPEPPRPAPATAMRLIGPAVVTVAQFEAYGRCGPVWLQELPCDSGATAADPVDGDVSAFIDACVPGFLFAEYGLTPCGIDTATPGEYTVKFSIVDSASGARVSVSRTVVVLSVEEAAARSVASAGSSSPVLQLRPVVGGDRRLRALVPRGTTYVACTPAMLQENALCEPGANSFQTSLTCYWLQCQYRTTFQQWPVRDAAWLFCFVLRPSSFVQGCPYIHSVCRC